MKEENENRSPHIMNTSANLLGFCFIVLTSVKVSKFEEGTYIDEGAAIAVFVFMTSCLLSYLSMKNRQEKIRKQLERAADLFFLSGLIVLFVITFLIVFNLIK